MLTLKPHFASNSTLIQTRGFNMGASAAQLDSMEEELVKTLADAAKHINKNYDVEGLHSSFPDRMEKLRKRGGDRLTEH